MPVTLLAQLANMNTYMLLDIHRVFLNSAFICAVWLRRSNKNSQQFAQLTLGSVEVSTSARHDGAPSSVPGADSAGISDSTLGTVCPSSLGDNV